MKDLDGYDENLREMDLFQQRMEKAKLSKELQKSQRVLRSMILDQKFTQRDII